MEDKGICPAYNLVRVLTKSGSEMSLKIERVYIDKVIKWLTGIDRAHTPATALPLFPCPKLHPLLQTTSLALGPQHCLWHTSQSFLQTQKLPRHQRQINGDFYIGLTAWFPLDPAWFPLQFKVCDSWLNLMHDGKLSSSSFLLQPSTQSGWGAEGKPSSVQRWEP